MTYRAFHYTSHLETLVPLLREVTETWKQKKLHASWLRKIIAVHPKSSGELFARDEIIAAYRGLAGSHQIPEVDPLLVQAMQAKPVRTQSGVAPITVLTKPYPCPGKCIFCPSDIRMPKSYLANEPGAQRAERNFFDPYLQTYTRLTALTAIGHTVEKAELIVLGGTWSFYPEAYQRWFICECFRALNDFGDGIDGRAEREQRYVLLSNDPEKNALATKAQTIDGAKKQQTYNQIVSALYTAPEKQAGVDVWQQATWEEVEAEQRRNETNRCRNVGLVVETRPDNITPEEVARIRRLGCTKTQIGIQSLQDSVLDANHRGHDVAATRKAFHLLRQAGFKIHAHWMPNLYGSSPEADKKDYDLLFSDPDFCPDELKIYPCSLLSTAELMQYYQKGLWQPYTNEQLSSVLAYVLCHTPRYCRLTRIIRDIPSTDIVVGNKTTNLRQVVEQQLLADGKKSVDIRSREIRLRHVTKQDLQRKTTEYVTSVSTEVFIEFVTADDRLVAFLRLSLPTGAPLFPELANAAMIREVHVYGQTLGLGKNEDGKAQHLGLGTLLLEEAKKKAHAAGFDALAVISAVGTRAYYRARGFSDGSLYQVCNTLSTSSTAKNA